MPAVRGEGQALVVAMSYGARSTASPIPFVLFSPQARASQL